MKKKRRALWLGVGAGIGVTLAVIAVILIAGGKAPASIEQPPSPLEGFPNRADAVDSTEAVRMAEADVAVMPGSAGSHEQPVSSDAYTGGGATVNGEAMPGVASEGSMGSEGKPPSIGMEPPPSTGAESPFSPDLAPQPCDFPHFIGRPVDEKAIKALGRPYRILPPGAMATMDFSPARINVETDDKGTVLRISCG